MSHRHKNSRASPSHRLFPQVPRLSANAEALLERLEVGENFSQPTPSFGPFTYSNHAEIFLSNAIRLCEDDGMSDFRVFGALYLLRHGLELMLKCLSRNARIDDILRTLTQLNMTFNTACERIWATKDERQKKMPILLHAVCVIRNRLEDQLVYPQCHEVNIDHVHADLALAYFQRNPELDRFYFAPLWPVAPAGHNLANLWKDSAPIFEEFSESAKYKASEIGFAEPLSSSELNAIVELLAAMDDGGDGLRYPSSISGAWYSDVPQLSLQALKSLAEQIESTCKVFRSVREDAYSMSTFGRPGPR